MDKNISKVLKAYIEKRRDCDFLKLCDEIKNPTKAFIMGILHDSYAVDDVFCKVIYDVYLNIGTFDETKSCFMSWVRTIAKNNAINYINAEKSSHSICTVSLSEMMDRLPDGQTIDDIPDVIHLPVEERNPFDLKSEIIDASLECLSTLPDEYCGYIVDQTLRGMQVKDIAVQAGIPVSTLKNRLRKSKAMLRETVMSNHGSLCSQYQNM